MYIFGRHVVIEVLKYFLAALAVLTLIVTLGMGIKEGLARGLPPIVMLKTMPFMIPEMLTITLPVAMLFAVATVYARMNGANEIVALKSLGIHPMVVVWPVLGLATALSLGAVWCNELAATWSRPTVKRIIAESVVDIAYGMLRTSRSFKSARFSITVKEVRGRKLIRPTIALAPGDNISAVTLRADEAELYLDREAGGVRIVCRRGQVDMEGAVQVTVPNEIQRVIPVEIPPRPIHRDWLATREIPRYIAQLERELGELQQKCAAAGGPQDERQTRDLQWLKSRVHRLRTEPYRRWANGFTCLCFVLLGTPVALLRRNADALSSFFLCFMPILAVYYPLLMLGEDLSTSGTLPPISFWTGNVVLASPGIWLLRRMIRY